MTICSLHIWQSLIFTSDNLLSNSHLTIYCLIHIWQSVLFTSDNLLSNSHLTICCLIQSDNLLSTSHLTIYCLTYVWQFFTYYHHLLMWMTGICIGVWLCGRLYATYDKIPVNMDVCVYILMYTFTPNCFQKLQTQLTQCHIVCATCHKKLPFCFTWKIHDVIVTLLNRKGSLSENINQISSWLFSDSWFCLLKATFSFHEITTKNTQMPTLYTN